ncbi:MAG: oligosaccharide flippase family protein, partial [Oscillospiraceae bacterium]|nr:oligosaccharide flippase family protein [Oscillospiraceae bacterium]
MKKQTFLQGSVILIASVVIAKVIGAVFKIPLTNLLGGTGMGYFSSAYGLFLPVYAVAVTGLAAAVAKLTAENAAFELYQNARKVKNVALVIFSVIGLAGSTAIVMLAKPFAVHVVANEKAYLSLIMIAPSIFFGCISSVYRGYYEGLRNMYPTALSQVTEAAVKLAAGLSLCLFVLSHPGILRYFPNNTDLTSVAAAAA